MFITVSCPKCGRSIKAKKKFVLSTGCVPCLKCKLRIPVTKEQVEAYSPAGAVAEEDSAGISEAEPVEAVATEIEPVQVPVPEPVPEADPLPVSEPEPVPAEAVIEDEDTITPAMTLEPEGEAPASETAPPTACAQIAFTCPYCQTTLPMRQSLAGKKIRCKSCSRIVKVASDSPLIPGTEPEPPPLPPPPPPHEDDDIPVIFSPVKTASIEPEPAASKPAQASIPETGPAPETIARLRKALAEAEERASSAEELLQQLTKEKTASEMIAFRKTRELEAQLRELTARLKTVEEQSRAAKPDSLKRAEVEALLKTLCEALDSNLKQEISAHQNLVDDLKRQLTQALR